MARVPTPREFAQLFRQMDLSTRARLSRDVRVGKVGQDADEAAMLAAAAHRELRATHWSMALAAALATLNVVTALSADFAVSWLDLAVAAVALVALVVFFLRASPLRVTERLNLERAEEST